MIKCNSQLEKQADATSTMNSF